MDDIEIRRKMVKYTVESMIEQYLKEHSLLILTEREADAFFKGTDLGIQIAQKVLKS